MTVNLSRLAAWLAFCSSYCGETSEISKMSEIAGCLAEIGLYLGNQ